MFEIPVWAVGVGFIILTVGVAQVLVRRLLPADRLPRLRASKRDLAEMSEEVQRRLGELDDMRNRLGELEERRRHAGFFQNLADIRDQMFVGELPRR